MMEPGEKPGYWAVLPSQIRYDSELPPNAKLLYAEISSLTDRTGYCFAANAYFEQLYGLSERTISRLIHALAKAGYIRVEDDAGGKERRRIYAGINPLAAPPDKNVSTPRQNCLYPPTEMSIPPDKNVTPTINKKVIKKDNNKKGPHGPCVWEPEMFERFWKAYPRGKDKDGARREWDKLKPDLALMRVMSAALDRDKASDDWQRGIGIPYACRWLRNRRWEDEPDDDLSRETAEAPDVEPAGERC